MSVLNHSSEEQKECPLCMEPFEVDDINFFPCTCGYQICRFCWHRIRTDENGLCPACRKLYSENPADFKPLSQEEILKLKAEKKQKDQQRKQKVTENRKQLANVRVVQKNLVFVVGLTSKLADPEVLKRHDYFGKFGKIHKVVINHSSSYAGTQGPSASAYVTYLKADDALRAIQVVNNLTIDGKTLKASLGTTKYCAHFMKNQQCPKPDCMYLHEHGDSEASFTKEEMQQGKHQEYERKLHEQLLAINSCPSGKEKCTGSSSPPVQGQSSGSVSQSQPKDTWPSLNLGVCSTTNSEHGKGRKGRDAGGSGGKRKNKEKNGTSQQQNQAKSPSNQTKQSQSDTSPLKIPQSQPQPIPKSQNFTTQNSVPDQPSPNSTPVSNSRLSQSPSPTSSTSDSLPWGTCGSSNGMTASVSANIPPRLQGRHMGQSAPEDDDRNSYFSSNGFSLPRGTYSVEENSENDWLTNSSKNCEDLLQDEHQKGDWHDGGVFGMMNSPNSGQSLASPQKPDDDLGFDPFHETQKALAEMMEKESQQQVNFQQHLHHQQHHQQQSSFMSQLQSGLRGPNHVMHHLRTMNNSTNGSVRQLLDSYGSAGPTNIGQARSRLPPPGFNTPNHINNYGMGVSRPSSGNEYSGSGSKVFPYLGLGTVLQNHLSNGPVTNSNLFGDNASVLGLNNHMRGVDAKSDVFNVKDLHDGLRTAMPGVNVSFPYNNVAASNSYTNQHSNHHPSMMPQHGQQKLWRSSPTDWTDPAIVYSGQVSDSRSDSPPPWFSAIDRHHSMPTIQQSSGFSSSLMNPLPLYGMGNPTSSASNAWPNTSAHAPPGFNTNSLRSTRTAEPQKIESKCW